MFDSRAEPDIIGHSYEYLSRSPAGSVSSVGEFYTTAPGIILFLNKAKPDDRKGKLFLLKKLSIVDCGNTRNE